MKITVRQRLLMLSIMLLIVAAFVFDLLIPLGINWPVFYVLPVSLCYFARQLFMLRPSVVLALSLMWLGLALSPSGSQVWVAAVNRLMASFAVLVVAGLVNRAKHKRGLLEADLEQQLAETQRHSEHLAKANIALERSNLDLRQFSYAASHDLQSPLRSIGGFLQLLQTRYADQLDERADEYIDRAMHGTERISHLLNDLLAHSRVDALHRPFTDVPMNQVFDTVCNTLDESIQSAEAQVTQERLPTVRGDLMQLNLLLEQLLGNALKFNEAAKPQVAVTVKPLGDDWQFTVQDNGIGIQPEYQEQVFEVFTRLHNRSEYPGSGLGLAICQRIVLRHNGKIWLESTPGEGTAVHFTLPKMTEQQTGPAAEDA